MNFKTLASSALASAILFVSGAQAAAGKAKHVVIVVMDGLRPDSVVAADMPNLTKLGQAGTFFANHHPVYVSSTEVNGTALATGMRPGRSGIVGNVEYRPQVDPLLPVSTQAAWAVWKGDDVSGGKWIAVDTLPEIVRAQGGKTAVAGTKEVALLWDRHVGNRTGDGSDVFAGDTIPGSLRDQLVSSIGPLPPAKDSRFYANSDQDSWTTRALVERIWAGGLPALSVLWLSEPDAAQHTNGPGSKISRLALKSSDDCLGQLLAALDASGKRAETDVMVVSDHGFSTVAQGLSVMSDVTRQGFSIGGAFLEKPEPGTVVMVSLGGSVSFYVVGQDKIVTDKLVKYLQSTQYAGVIFTREGVEGTFPFSQAGIDAATAPDIFMAMRWSSESLPREGAMPGILLTDGSGYAQGQGMHGSLSKFDMNNTLIAAGPDFKVGFRSATPSANTDVAPTVLNILGMSPRQPMYGRVLTEAFAGSTAEAPKVETQTLRATQGSWQQYLKISKVGNQTYLDEGNSGDGK